MYHKINKSQKRTKIFRTNYLENYNIPCILTVFYNHRYNNVNFFGVKSKNKKITLNKIIKKCV